MDSRRAAALALLVAGVLGLVYGSFTYTKGTHDVKVGSLEFSVTDKESVNIPIWVGVAATWPAAGCCSRQAGGASRRRAAS